MRMVLNTRMDDNVTKYENGFEYENGPKYENGSEYEYCPKYKNGAKYDLRTRMA